MNFFKNIRLNYNLKLFIDYIKNENFHLAANFLEDIKSKNINDLYFILKNTQNLFRDLPNDFYKKKIIWNLSYDLDDLLYINNFISFYLNKNLNKSFDIKNYASTLSNYFSKNKQNDFFDKITFENFTKNSTLFQNLALYSSNQEYLFLNSCASFFETNGGSYFINPNITYCFFYIVADPSDLFLRYKYNLNSVDAAFDQLFNFTGNYFLDSSQAENKMKVYENRTNLNINFKSWNDQNVLSTFKGKVITLKQLENETEETLIEIIYHLRQYGMNININLDDVKAYVSENKFNHKKKEELSNKEKKFMDKNLDQLLLNY